MLDISRAVPKMACTSVSFSPDTPQRFVFQRRSCSLRNVFDEMVALIVWVLTTYRSLLPSSWDPQGFQRIQPHFRQLRRGQNAMEIYGDVQ